MRKQLFSLGFTAIIAGAVGFYTGAMWGRQSEFEAEVKNGLKSQLATNIVIYRDFKQGTPDLAKSNVNVFLTANIMTYQYYRKKFSNFGANDDQLQTLLDQANQAMLDEKKAGYQVPEVVHPGN